CKPKHKDTPKEENIPQNLAEAPATKSHQGLSFQLAAEDKFDVFRLVVCRHAPEHDELWRGSRCISFYDMDSDFDHLSELKQGWTASLYGCQLQGGFLNFHEGCTALFSQDSLAVEAVATESEDGFYWDVIRSQYKKYALETMLRTLEQQQGCSFEAYTPEESKENLGRIFAQIDAMVSRLRSARPQETGLQLTTADGEKPSGDLFKVRLFLMRPKEFLNVNIDVPMMEHAVAVNTMVDQLKSLIRTRDLSIFELGAAAKEFSTFDFGVPMGAGALNFDLIDTAEHLLPNVQPRTKSPTIHPTSLAIAPGLDTKIITHMVREAAGLNFELGMEVTNGEEKYYFSGSGVRTLENDLDFYDDWRMIELDQEVTRFDLDNLFALDKLQSVTTMMQASNHLHQFNQEVGKLLEELEKIEDKNARAMVKRAIDKVVKDTSSSVFSWKNLKEELDTKIKSSKVEQVASMRFFTDPEKVAEAVDNFISGENTETIIRAKAAYANFKAIRLKTRVAGLKYNKFNRRCTQQICRVLNELLQTDLQAKVIDSPRRLYRRIKSSDLVSLPEEIALGEKQKWYKHITNVKFSVLEDTRSLLGVRNLEKLASEKAGRTLPTGVEFSTVEKLDQLTKKMSSMSFASMRSRKTSGSSDLDSPRSLDSFSFDADLSKTLRLTADKPVQVCAFASENDFLQYQAWQWIQLQSYLSVLPQN
ncbi:MAG: hypothetical protein OXT67_08175, partial [Zetaproteobacteria bacterium]|nr:hypothetical protein [Zetaproteobacteria bacterium]